MLSDVLVPTRVHFRWLSLTSCVIWHTSYRHMWMCNKTQGSVSESLSGKPWTNTDTRPKTNFSPAAAPKLLHVLTQRSPSLLNQRVVMKFLLGTCWLTSHVSPRVSIRSPACLLNPECSPLFAWSLLKFGLISAPLPPYLPPCLSSLPFRHISPAPSCAGGPVTLALHSSIWSIHESSKSSSILAPESVHLLMGDRRDDQGYQE